MVTWWAPSSNTPDSGLHRLLFGRGIGSADVPEQARIPSDDQAATAAGRACRPRRSDDRGCDPGRRRRRSPRSVVPAPRWPSGRFTRALDTAWRRTSYSALAAAAGDGARGDRHAGVGSEPEDGERDDEALESDVTAAGGDPELLGDPVTDGRPAGRYLVRHPGARRPGDHRSNGAGPAGRVALAQHANNWPADRPGSASTSCPGRCWRRCSTPLGPIMDGLALRDLPVHDRLAELDFEIPLAGGDLPDPLPAGETRSAGDAVESSVRDVTLGDVGDLLRKRLAPGDPLAGYARRLASPGMSWQSLRGYLTGSLDAVFRLPGPRYVVADYKTNWLGDFSALGESGAGESGSRLSAWHYRPEALDDAMAGSDYPLQALLYCVALHRFLRWRQPGYDPERHLGGVLYLFVRGMCGVANPEVDGRPCGVFGWRPPAELVVELSALLDAKPPGSP